MVLNMGIIIIGGIILTLIALAVNLWFMMEQLKNN